MSQLFTTGSGQTVIAGAELGRGGEGTVLEVRGDPSRCIKLYSGQTAEPTLGKLSAMIARPPLDPTFSNRRHHSIAWPEQLLFKAPGQTAFAGFLMPRVDGKVFRTALSYLSPESRVKELGGVFNWRYLYTAAINVASSVGALHEKGYCIGDLNESNLLIAPNALITIIDCDSFQVPDPATGKVYRCLVGKPEYTAPELQGRYGEIDRTLATDRFALGVLLFQLLMEGTHPYQSRGEAVEDLPSTLSHKAGLSGLLWTLLLALTVHYEFIPLAMTSVFTWAALFASAAWMTGPAALKLRARGVRLPYPILAACALLTALVVGFAYFPAIQAEILDLPEQAAPPPLTQSKPFRVEVMGGEVNLRRLPDRDSAILERVSGGTVLEVDSTFGPWFRVKRPRNPAEPGWVHQDLVRRLDARAATPEQPAATTEE
jgi:serine/threonine protein kinase